MNIVVFLSDSTQCSTHFFGLFVAELPRWDHVIGLEQSVARHKVVLRPKIVITVSNKLAVIDHEHSSSNFQIQIDSKCVDGNLPILLASSEHLLLVLLFHQSQDKVNNDLLLANLQMKWCPCGGA